MSTEVIHHPLGSKLPSGTSTPVGEKSRELPVDQEKASTSLEVTAIDIPPDGGLKAWTTVIGAFFILFATNGYTYSFGVYQDYYTRIYLPQKTPSQISWIGSLQYTFPFLFGVISGRLFDRGYFYPLSIAGCILYAFSAFMISLSKKDQFYQVFLSQGIGMGLGLGIIWVPVVSIPSHHFRRRRALAVGVALSGCAFGAVIFPIMLNRLLQRMPFGDAVRASGYLILGTLIIGNLLMRTRPLPPRKEYPSLIEFLKEPSYLLLVLAIVVMVFGVLFPLVYMQLFAITHGLDVNLAFYSLAIINAAGFTGRIVGNHLADSLGPINMLIPAGAGSTLSIWLMLAINNSASLIIISIIYGAFSGAYLSLSVSALASLAKLPSDIGSKTGLGLAIVSFGLLGSSPAQGALLTSSFHWIRPIAFSGTMTGVATVLHIAVRMRVAREKGSRWV